MGQGRPLNALRGAKTIGPTPRGQQASNKFDKTVDVLLGLLGVGPETKENLTGQLINTGLPLLKGLGALKLAGIPLSKTVYHGTPYKWDKPAREMLDESDTLGHLFHLAENERYAEQYASGTMKATSSGGKYIPGKGTIFPEVEPKVLKGIVSGDDVLNIGPDVNKIPSDDVARVIAANRAVGEHYGADKIKEAWKKYYKDQENWEGELGTIAHGTASSGPPVSGLSRRIRDSLQNEQTFKLAGFDAIRYSDVGEPAWAIPIERFGQDKGFKVIGEIPVEDRFSVDKSSGEVLQKGLDAIDVYLGKKPNPYTGKKLSGLSGYDSTYSNLTDSQFIARMQDIARSAGWGGMLNEEIIKISNIAEKYGLDLHKIGQRNIFNLLIPKMSK